MNFYAFEHNFHSNFLEIQKKKNRTTICSSSDQLNLFLALQFNWIDKSTLTTVQMSACFLLKTEQEDFNHLFNFLQTNQNIWIKSPPVS